MSKYAKQEKYRREMREKGFVQVNVWAPVNMAREIQIAAALSREYPHLEMGTLRDTVSGKLVSLHGKGE